MRFHAARTPVALALVLAACSSGAEPTGPGSNKGPGTVEIFPTYVQRFPAMDFVAESTDPTRQGWPAPGQGVTWRAHVRNLGDTPVDAPYSWTLDGAPVDSGVASIPADSTATVDYRWPWTFDRHQLAFVVDPHNTIHEENEQNNRILLYTDALSVGFWVESSFYDFYRAHIHEAAPALSSFEDWAQAHIDSMNGLFAAAKYDETPDGVLDRVRLDKIVVVPDGTLPSVVQPAPNDHSVDLEWGFKADEVDGLRGPGDSGFAPTFAYNGTTIHELGHARYLTDVYLWDLIDGFMGTKIDIQEGGAPLVGSPYLPVLTIGLYNDTDTIYVLYRTPEHGLMNRDYTYVDRYSAIALNLIAHQRPRYGNYNCPRNCGEFMNDLPAQNDLDLEDQDGAPLADDSVWIYRSATYDPDPSDATPPLSDYFDDTPDLVGRSDGGGSFAVGQNPFGVDSPGGSFPVPRRHLIVRVKEGAEIGYAIVESRLFNLAYWHGETSVAHYPVTVKMVAPG
jgi:hypothetical protein